MESSFNKQPTLVGIEPLSPALPRQIGPYKIESLLSKGGMGLVYMGIHPKTKEMLIIKVLSPAYVAYPDMVNRFFKEAKIIGMTNHPNIVKLYGEGEWEGGLYIAMEFIRGVSLRQFIEQHSLSMKRCIDIILQVAYALVHLHSHGVIHGDLKPENILIMENGEVKVIDFGIARLHEEVKKEGGGVQKILGTPTYMSPEQKEDPSNISFASDIYSLGIIGYELFSGKLCFGVVHLSQIPKGLRPIFEEALAVSLKERYPSAIKFISDLSEYLKSGGLEKDRPGTDQLKEILEAIQQAGQALSPSTPPSWGQLEIGIARSKILGQDGNYFDYFKFQDNTYGIVIVEPITYGLENPIFIANLRGLIRALVVSRPDFSFSHFIKTLNKIIHDDPLSQRFSIAFLLLSPSRDELNFLSCGLGNLIHLSPDHQMPRILTHHHAPLGSDLQENFDKTTDNWNIGDILVFHSFPPKFDQVIQESLKESLYLSPQSQADAILKRNLGQPGSNQDKKQKIVLILHRIS